MGASQRRKGRVGELDVQHLLEDRDWIVDRTRVGVKTDDMLATDPGGILWSVEVKRCRIVNLPKFKEQARKQAKSRRARWMLVCHLSGTSEFLVMRQGEPSSVWKKAPSSGQNVF